MNDVNLSCKNCGAYFSGKFCNTCGEKVYKENDRSMSKLFHEAFHFITHFEGSFLTSLKAIVTSPGKISLDYCNGIRKKYFKPLSFFLLLVILYLLFPLFEGLNMKLYYHTHHSLYGTYASQKVTAIMEAREISFTEVEKIFHQKGEKTSKIILFTILPFMALISWLLAFKKRKFYFDNFIFCTEATSFFILWGFLIFPLILSVTTYITGIVLIKSEWQTGLVIVLAQIIYTGIAARRFFFFKRWYSILYACLFITMLFLYLETIYKFILFFIAFSVI